MSRYLSPPALHDAPAELNVLDSIQLLSLHSICRMIEV